MKKRVARYLVSSNCPKCHGKRLRPESLAVTFEGSDFAELAQLPLVELNQRFSKYADQATLDELRERSPEKAKVIERIAADLLARLDVLLDLGLGYLTLERSTPTLSPGELQRLRLATQVRSNLFGVVYVLDEPSAGLHPADTEALLRALDRLKASGNSVFVIEHEIDVIRHADWVVDVGPKAGQHGGEILYSGALANLKDVEVSLTARHLFNGAAPPTHVLREPNGWLKLSGITVNNLHELDVAFPLGVLTTVTGVSGSGKSSLVSQALVDLISEALGGESDAEVEEIPALDLTPAIRAIGRITQGMDRIRRLIQVDQKPIGRTPRSNLATYTGLFDAVRKLFAATRQARARRYDAGRFSFNVAKGRCETCQGEGFVMVELLFLPSVYAPCPTCHGARYNAKTLEITYHEKNIAEVLALTVDDAYNFFENDPAVRRPLEVLREVGLGYLRLGQPATELSGGEAQRIKLATELQRAQRNDTLYVLDEPTTGLHPEDVEKLMLQLNKLVDAGSTVIVIEHDMRVVSRSDWIIDIGPGAGAAGGSIVAQGTPKDVATAPDSKTAPYLRAYLEHAKL